MISRWRRTLWASIFAGWMLIAVSFTFNYFYYAHHYVEIFTTPPTFFQMLVWEIPYWILWAAMAPLVFGITRRFPLDRESWTQNALVHVAACLALTVGHRLVYLALCRMLYVDAYRNIPTLVDLYRSDLLFNLPTGFMSYGTFLLVGNVIEFYRRYQAGELKASQLETQLARAELQALKSQLQPHFLFNTLYHGTASWKHAAYRNPRRWSGIEGAGTGTYRHCQYTIATSAALWRHVPIRNRECAGRWCRRHP